MENIQKGLIFLFAAIGLYIFYSVIMYKLDVMATETKAKIEETSSDMQWEDYRNLKNSQGQEGEDSTADDQNETLP